MKIGWALPWALALVLGAFVACASASPTPSPRTPWVDARLDAFAQIYGIKPEGREVLAALDVRHMAGQPAWFGSTGFDGFAGIGESKLGTIAHELSHSYWGAFPVTGRPDLSWDVPRGEDIAPALAEYRNDLERFMLQPPDRYELLRERFRNLPNLSEGDLPDLVHIGETDMVSLVAGNLNLVPPVLRKYYDQYL
ncbi:MAG: hypothetical protein ACE5JL_06520, partial [Dehalococcoidia bacterium]